jgi:branched-chain amino acid transport system ATP-binding protein
MTLIVKGVSKAFGGLQVLEEISFSVGPAERVGIVGPNGAGKSTLFAVISGFQRSDQGTVEFAGQQLSGLSPTRRARLGLVRTFQVPRPFGHLTVRENLVVAAPAQHGERLVSLFARPWKVGAQDRAMFVRADEVLSFLRLAHVADAPAGQLSGGQMKLLELGRVLMTNPKFVMLDEPFAGVNPVLIEQIAGHVRDLNAQGVGCLIIEHNLAALSDLCPSLIALDGGRILATGTPDQVLSDPEVQNAYLGGR